MTIFQTAKLLPLVGLMGVSACESSGGSDDGVTLRQLAQQENALAAAFVGPTLAGAAIPDSGSATYDGQLAFGAETAEFDGRLIGQMEMTVGFAGDGSVSGTVDEFVYVNFDGLDVDAILPTVDGTLTFENGSINRVDQDIDDQLFADLNGTLVSSVDAFGIAAGTDLVVDGNILGTFGSNYVTGFTDGSITAEGGTVIEFDSGGFDGVAQ